LSMLAGTDFTVQFLDEHTVIAAALLIHDERWR